MTGVQTCALPISATSVNIELGQMINKQEFMQKLVENFFAQYHEFLINGFVFIKEDYEKRASFLEQQLKIGVFNIIKEGFCKGVDDNGNLILLMPDGKIEKINMGEIVE